MGMKIGGEGQFDVLKMIGFEPNPKMSSEAIFRPWDHVGDGRSIGYCNTFITICGNNMKLGF